MADENGGGGSGNINEENYHNVAQRDGNEESYIFRASTVEDPGAETHQEVVASSGENNEGGVGIKSVEYAVEDPYEPDIFIAGMLHPHFYFQLYSGEICANFFALGHSCGIGGIGGICDVVGDDR